MKPYETDPTEGPLRRIARGLAEHRRRRRDHERLKDMPDCLLDDIGLTRDRVGAVRKYSAF